MSNNLNFEKHNREVIEYYDNRIKRTMTPTGNLYTQNHMDEFLKVTCIKPGDDVLDVGCGMGRYTIPLAARGVNVEGVDISQFLLNRLTEYNNSGYDIPTYCLDIVNYLPEMENRYDAVVGFFVLHHMHDMNSCFSAPVKLVKPGGVVAFL